MNNFALLRLSPWLAKLFLMGIIMATLWDNPILAQQGRRFRERANRQRLNANNLATPGSSSTPNANNANLGNPAAGANFDISPNANGANNSIKNNVDPNRADLDTLDQDPIFGGGGQQRLDRLQRLQERQERRLDRQNGNALAGFAGFGGGLPLRAWVKLLKINNEQLQRFQLIRRNSAMDYLRLQLQIRRKNQELQRTIYSETYNEEAIKQVATELARLEGQRMLMRARIQAQIRQVLTTEQVRALNDLRTGSAEDDLGEDKPAATPNKSEPSDRKE
jgi:Spy/CpxP family protein refolding chaperone